MIKKSPRVLLLVDWNPKNGSLLQDYLQKAGLNCDIMGTDFRQSLWTPVNKVLFHWPRCLWVSIKAFNRRHYYDYVIAWPQIMGMILGFIKLITCSNSPNVFLLNTTIIERKNSLLEALRRWFLLLSFKKVNHISFMSVAYMHLIQDRFKLAKNQLIHLRLPINYKKNPNYSGFKPNSYLYSVGLSYRDFPTLMEAANKSSKQFVLATTDAFLKGLTIPNNVTVYRNAFGNAAEELMKQSAAVIFPLERTSSPAGETTLVSAMFYGKPVITTKTIITQEYIIHGENGLLVPAHDPDAILDAVDFLFNNPEKAEAIAQSARQTVLKNHTMGVYANKIIDIIENNL